MNILEALRNSKKVIKEGLITPNKFNKVAADRFKGSALPMLGIPGAVADTADQLYQGNPGSAGLAALGAIPGGMMIGKGAKVWDAIAAEEATRLLRKGIDPHSATGTHEGVDGILRQEIPDNKAQLRPGAMETLNASDDMELQMVLDHPELFKAYPELKGMSVASARGEDSYYHPEWDSIGLGKDTSDPLSALLHETQHKIQQTEGWAKGGSPESFSMKYPPLSEVDWSDISPVVKKYGIAVVQQKSPMAVLEQVERGMKNNGATSSELATVRKQIKLMQSKALTPTDQYKRLAGEVEARNTQNRQSLTAMDRRREHPYESMDRDIDKQAVWGVGEELPGVVQKNVIEILRKKK